MVFFGVCPVLGRGIGVRSSRDPYWLSPVRRAWHVGCQEEFSHLQARIRSRELSGLLLAPPSETWRVAHSRPGSDTTATWPRVSRQRDVSWGFSGLTTAELKQLLVANSLVFVALLLALECVLHSVPFILEHPAEPRGNICLLSGALGHWLLTCPVVQRHLVNQSDFGAISCKPTHFMTGWIKDFDRILASEQGPTPECDLQTLSDRDESGCKTRHAKEFPPWLNRALALVLLSTRVNNWSLHPPQVDLSTDFASFIDHLEEAQRPVEEQQIQPDYAGDRSPCREL